VKRTGVNVFDNCLSISSLNLPDSIAFLDVSALHGIDSASISRDLAGCGSLIEKVFCWAEGMRGSCSILAMRGLFPSIPRRRLLDRKAFGALLLPQGFNLWFSRDSLVYSIWSMAFAHCYCLTSELIPGAVLHWGERSFWCCEALSSVEFVSPSRLTHRGCGVFGVSGADATGDSSLEEVSFEPQSRLRRIERNNFLGAGLRSFSIPTSTEFAHGSAFNFRQSQAAIRNRANGEK
jgi:hypothetical protein